MKDEVSKFHRPSWDEYFLGMAGYVGSPPGLPHCDEVGHEFHTMVRSDGSKSEHCGRTSHAEENAIVQAARFGVKLEGGTLYSKMVPCYTCAKITITAGIKRVVSSYDYQASSRTKDIFKQAGVELVIINKEILKY